MEDVFYLLLSDGSYITQTVWKGEYGGLMALYNGGNAAYTFSETTRADGYLLLYGEAAPALSDGTLHAEIPPHSLVILAEDSGEKRGFMKDNILYRRPVPGSTVHCEDDAFLGIYAIYNGKPELTGLYVNGDVLKDGEGMFRFFRWDENMKPIK